jgi:hypothetical protein
MSRSSDPLPPLQRPGGPPASAARRRLLRGSFGAAPVLMVSAPRSVMAGMCTQASSFASINTSRPDVTMPCLGKAPDWWKEPSNSNQWPAAYKPTGGNATFSAVFGAPLSFEGFNDTSLLNVLQFGDSSGPRCLAKHMVAGALNALTGRVPAAIASLNILTEIYSSYRANLGYYEPTAGIKWYCDTSSVGPGGITPWLRSTMV